jgi:hypothetical protein
MSPDWLPQDRSWLGVRYIQRRTGLLALSRSKARLPMTTAMATTFAMQAIVALENARLHDEVTSINQMMNAWSPSVWRN